MLDAVASVSRGMALALVSMAALMHAAIAAEQKVHLFAAASTAAAIDEIAEAAGAAFDGPVVVPVFASSGTLARQIVNGAPAAIFLSADPRWMTLLSEQKLIDESSRRDLLGNCLVLVQPVEDAQPFQVDASLPDRLGRGRLAIADPALAPLGAYARKALQSVSLWKPLQPKIVIQPNARALLALASRGEVAAAILYESDLTRNRRLRIVHRFATTHVPGIRYPTAIVAGRDGPAVRRVFDFLTSDPARAIFWRHGFREAGQPCPS